MRIFDDTLGPDGYKSWSEFRKELNTGATPYHPKWNHAEIVRIDTRDGAVFLYPDRTWGYDCAPDWDGSS